jgi:tetratricopeptide (TPR) repeat protein
MCKHLLNEKKDNNLLNNSTLSKDQVEHIIVLYSDGSFLEALEAIQDLLIAYPNDPLLLNISGACYAGLEQFDKAVQRYKQALSFKPDYAEAYNNLGIVFDNLNSLKDAVKSYISATNINPDYAEAYNNLGNTQYRLGQLDDAIQSYERALTINPNFNNAFNNLGMVLKDFGNLNESVRVYEKIIELNPEFAEAYNNLGVALIGLNKIDDAVKNYYKALEINPEFAEACNNLGIAQRKNNQIKQAVKSFKKSVFINANYFQAHLNLASAFHEIGFLSHSVDSYQDAIAINPDYAEAYNDLGVVLQQLGQVEYSVKNYKKAISIEPDYFEAHNNLGIAYQELGQFGLAIESFESAVSSNPDYAEGYHNLSYLKKYKLGDKQINEMEALLDRDNLNLSDKIHLCLALATINENLGDNKKFFKFLHKGNGFRRKELKYSFDKDKKLFLTIKKIFSTPQLASSQFSEKRPVFIVGMPRSGTTLVEQILASHSKVYGAGELDILDDIITTSLEEYPANSDLFYENFLKNSKKYIDYISSRKISENFFTDKMPLNFRYIGFILSAFPEAKIVHLVRDARATCWSNYKCFFIKKENGYSYNLDDLGQFYSLYHDLMIFWHEKFPNKIYDLCYEDLTVNQEEETRNLLNYCELEWDEACLNFHSNKRELKTASAVQVRQKMYQGSSDAWKKHKDNLSALINALSPY